jgi:hypothetical protein
MQINPVKARQGNGHPITVIWLQTQTLRVDQIRSRREKFLEWAVGHALSEYR